MSWSAAPVSAALALLAALTLSHGLLAAADPPAAPPTDASPLARAERLYAAGEYAPALEAFRAAVTANPADLDAHRGYQNSLRKLGHADRALAEYKERVAREPVSAVAHYLYGRLLDGAEFERELRASLQLEPHFFQPRLALAQFYLKTGRTVEAIPELRECLQIRPLDADAHRLFAFACFKTEKLELAEDHYRRALQIRPDDLDARRGMGLLLKSLGRYSEAADQLLAVVRKLPAAWRDYSPLIQCLTASGRYDEAAPWRRALLELYARTTDAELRKTPEVEIDLVDLHDLFLLVYQGLDRRGDSWPVFRVRVLKKGALPDRPLGILTLQYTRFNPPERVYELVEERRSGPDAAPTRIVYLAAASEPDYVELLPRLKELARSIQDRRDE